MPDFRIGDLDDRDGQVTRDETEEDGQHHLRDPPLAAPLLDLPGIPTRGMGRLDRGRRRCMLPHSRFRPARQICFYIERARKKKPLSAGMLIHVMRARLAFIFPRNSRP